MILKNENLRSYLDLKGFTTDDLFNAHAVIMDDDKFVLSDSGESWLDEQVAFDEENETAVTAKNILEKKQGQYIHDSCTAAIFVPLFNLAGKFTGLSIRKMCDNKHDSWFVPGSRKIDMIYNLNSCFAAASKKNSIILTEGVYDTIALQKYGFVNSGALLGTNLSNLQFFQLFSIVDNIALCLDNDSAGKEAVKKIYNNYKNSVTFYTVDIDKDPDEFLKEHGRDEFKKRIRKIDA